MRVFGIVGDGAGAVATRLTSHLDGPVAVIEATTALDHTTTSDTYRIGADGSWNAVGSDRTLETLIDDLAARYAYAICLGDVGDDGRTLPVVALGDSETENVLLRADDADSVEIDRVLDSLEAVEPHITLESLVEQVKASPRAERAGAIATFTGRVRAKDADDDPRTTALEFEKYEGVAEERMARICRELEERDGVFDVAMHHRVGRILDGDDIVFVVVLAGHRDEAFRTVEDGINRLKDEVPLFKKEVTVEETFWRHER